MKRLLTVLSDASLDLLTDIMELHIKYISPVLSDLKVSYAFNYVLSHIYAVTMTNVYIKNNIYYLKNNFK